MRLSKAITLAATVHADQTDKSGAPYILHPLRVMLMGRNESERVVGVLHDVLEDCKPRDRLEVSNAAAKITSLDEYIALGLLTRYGETYTSFIDRIANSGSQLAICVKLNDLTDNLRPLGRDATRADLDRVERYHRAIAVLMEVKEL